MVGIRRQRDRLRAGRQPNLTPSRTRSPTAEYGRPRDQIIAGDARVGSDGTVTCGRPGQLRQKTLVRGPVFSFRAVLQVFGELPEDATGQGVRVVPKTAHRAGSSHRQRPGSAAQEQPPGSWREKDDAMASATVGGSSV